MDKNLEPELGPQCPAMMGRTQCALDEGHADDHMAGFGVDTLRWHNKDTDRDRVPRSPAVREGDRSTAAGNPSTRHRPSGDPSRIGSEPALPPCADCGMPEYEHRFTDPELVSLSYACSNYQKSDLPNTQVSCPHCKHLVGVTNGHLNDHFVSRDGRRAIDASTGNLVPPEWGLCPEGNRPVRVRKSDYEPCDCAMTTYGGGHRIGCPNAPGVDSSPLVPESGFCECEWPKAMHSHVNALTRKCVKCGKLPKGYTEPDWLRSERARVLRWLAGEIEGGRRTVRVWDVFEPADTQIETFTIEVERNG